MAVWTNRLRHIASEVVGGAPRVLQLAGVRKAAH